MNWNREGLKMISRSGRLRAAVSLSMAFGVVACGDGAAEPEMDMLSLEESEAMLEALQSIGVTELEDDLGSPNVDITRACPGGGAVTATGTVLPSGAEDMSTIALDLTLVPSACMVTAQGRSFMLNGAPSLRQTATLSVRAVDELTFVIDIDLAMFGTLTYGLQGRSGTCDVSLRVVSRVDLGALVRTETRTGELCGNSVDVELSEPLSPQG